MHESRNTPLTSPGSWASGQKFSLTLIPRPSHLVLCVLYWTNPARGGLGTRLVLPCLWHYYNHFLHRVHPPKLHGWHNLFPPPPTNAYVNNSFSNTQDTSHFKILFSPQYLHFSPPLLSYQLPPHPFFSPSPQDPLLSLPLPSSLPSILQQQWCSATNNKESIIYPTHKHHNVINKRWTKKCPKRMINAKIKPLMNYSCLSVCLSTHWSGRYS